MKNFVIVTTNNLPEAFFLVKKIIEGKKANILLINIRNRTPRQSFVVVKRLIKNRGIKYFIGLILSKAYFKCNKRSRTMPFPEINAKRIAYFKKLITYRNIDDINSEKAKEVIESFGPDYMLIAGAPVIKDFIFKIAKYGTLNRHLGISPEYRGSDCPLWAMANNEFNKIGYTIHFVSNKVDGGDILKQERIQIPKAISFKSVTAHINRTGSEGYWQVISDILNDKIPIGKKQTLGGRHYPPAHIGTVILAKKFLTKYNL